MERNDVIEKLMEGGLLLERFLKYISIDTMSDSVSKMIPSSKGQLDFAEILVSEFHAMGINNAHVDEHGYVYAHIDANIETDMKVAFLAHLDTVEFKREKPFKYIIHDNYDCSPIVLPSGNVLSPDLIPDLKSSKHDMIITSDGYSILGADDKAGIAEIMAVIAVLMKNKKIPRPHLRICFVPDEQLGKGIDKIDIGKFDADFGFTVDAGLPYNISCDSFNAWECIIDFKGVKHDEGYAKGRMVSALNCASEFISMIPGGMMAEYTSRRDGYIHPSSLNGDVGDARLILSVRDFEEKGINTKKQFIKDLVDFLKKSHHGLNAEISYKEIYSNINSAISANPCINEILDEAMYNIRGSENATFMRTGATLSFMGVPCPNIFSGVGNSYSVEEWVSCENMILSAVFIIEIIKAAASFAVDKGEK